MLSPRVSPASPAGKEKNDAIRFNSPPPVTNEGAAVRDVLDIGGREKSGVVMRRSVLAACSSSGVIARCRFVLGLRELLGLLGPV